MNKPQRDNLMVKLIAIDRDFRKGRGHEDDAFTNLLRINLTLIDELYSTQKELAELKQATMPAKPERP